MACWQHIRTYSCSACWLNIQLVALSATSSETQVNMDNTKLLRLSVTSIHTYLHKCDKTNSTQWALSYTYAFKYSYICILLNFPHVENGAVWFSNQFYRCKSVIPAFTCIWMILMIVCVCVCVSLCVCARTLCVWLLFVFAFFKASREGNTFIISLEDIMYMQYVANNDNYLSLLIRSLFWCLHEHNGRKGLSILAALQLRQV